MLLWSPRFQVPSFLKEQKKSVEGCSDTFKRVFTQNGSVLEHIADTKGLSPRFQVPSFLAPNQMLSLALLV
jgi:hypothetical protein